MRSAHCYVCNDAKKHRIKVNDLERIYKNMRIFARERVDSSDLNIRRNDKLRKVMLNLDCDKPSVHYMCGHCTKVNERELDIAYDRVKKAYMELVVILLKTKDEDYFSHVKYNLKRLFSGYLPRYARSLDLITFNSENEM